MLTSHQLDYWKVYFLFIVFLYNHHQITTTCNTKKLFGLPKLPAPKTVLLELSRVLESLVFIILETTLLSNARSIRQG